MRQHGGAAGGPGPRRSHLGRGSAYTIGVANALQTWRPYLADPDACLVLSDLVWLTDTPPEEALAFWQPPCRPWRACSKR